ALGPFVDAFEITPLLAIKLDEGCDNVDGFRLGLDVPQNFGALDVEAGGPGEVYLVARVDTDDADVLASRLGAIAWTPRNRHLDLGRRPRTPQEFFELDAETRRVLGAEAAPVAADAGLHRAERLAIG